MQVLSIPWVPMTNLPERGDSPGSSREDGSPNSFKGSLADLLLGDTNLDDFLAYVPDGCTSNENIDQSKRPTAAKSQGSLSSISHRAIDGPSFVSSSSSSSSFQPNSESAVGASVDGASIASKLGDRLVKREEVEEVESFDAEDGINLKRKATTLQSRSSSSSSSPAKKRQMTWTRFTHIEEVILVGAIMKRFFTKGRYVDMALYYHLY